MRRSTIYSRCPGCHRTGLVQPVQDTYRCAICNFDYRTLASDQVAREAWMVENLRLGVGFALFVLHLHRVITGLPIAESNARVLAFAEQHGIALPRGKPLSGKQAVAIAIGAILFFVALSVAIGLLAG